MKQFTVDTFKTNNKNNYILLEGYFVSKFSGDKDPDYFSETIVFGYVLKNKNETDGIIVGYSILKLLKKINSENYSGFIRIIGKPATCMTTAYNINNILKVELLDEQGNVIKTAKAAESTIPKELRDKI